MDTATHFVMGVSLAGLANISPTINSDPVLAQSVLLATIIASQAPDFDGVTRFFGGTASYIKNHRGITHSFPALLLWPILISLALVIFYPVDYLPQLLLWSFLAVSIHISMDLLNSYGTQVLRPFSNKWVTFNIINIFDPFIFVIHTLAIIIWSIDLVNVKILFLTTYLLTIFYIIWRIFVHKQIKGIMKQQYKLKGNITILPTIKWSVFNIIQETPLQYNIAIFENGNLEFVDKKVKKKDNNLIKLSKQNSKVQAFLYFSSYAFPEIEETSYGYRIQWIDLRYRFNNHYPFLAITLIDKNSHIIDSYVGWIYNQKHFQKKENTLLKQNL